MYYIARMKNIVLSFLLLCFTGFTYAQKFTATVSKNPVAAGEAFQITYSIDGSESGFQMPDLSAFNVLAGPNATQSMQIINGAMSQSVYYSYTVSAKKEGKFTIGPASTNAGGKRVQSNSLNIEVTKGTAPSKNQQQTGQGPAGGDNIFIKTSVSKSTVFLGEQVILTQKVYTRVNLLGFQGAKIPSYTGFWSQEVPGQAQFSVGKEVLNGIQYSVVEFKKTFLFPQRSGTLEIEPLELDAVVRQQSSRKQDPWSLFGPTVEDVAYKLKGQKIKVEVMPLPEQDKPKSFSGAVGVFTLKAKISKEKVKVNEAINLNVSVSGKGNINLLDLPRISPPHDLESYDPKPAENFSVTASGVDGAKSNEYVLIPRYRGTYKIDPVEFSYFDPQKKSYTTLHTPEFSIQVDRADGDTSSASGLAPVSNRNEVTLIGNDIRYIQTNHFPLFIKGKHFFGSVLFYAGYIVPGICFILFLIFRRRHLQNNSDLQLVKSRKATKMAKKRLVMAQTHLQNNSKDRFYEEIFRALYGYLGDKLFMPVSDLSKESIATALEQKMVSGDTIRQLMDTIDACEFARYASSSAPGDLKSIYEQSILLITKMEEEISKGKKNQKSSMNPGERI
jgi:hypothetical protein